MNEIVFKKLLKTSEEKNNFNSVKKATKKHPSVSALSSAETAISLISDEEAKKIYVASIAAR